MMFKKIFWVPIVILILGVSSLSARAQDTGALDGTWEGTLTRIHGAGLDPKDYPEQTWRIAVQGETVRMFIQRDGKFLEIKPGKFRMIRDLNNTLIYSLDSGSDSDGPWIETEVWSILKKSPTTLGITFAGAINNPTAKDPALTYIANVETSTFQRLNP